MRRAVFISLVLAVTSACGGGGTPVPTEGAGSTDMRFPVPVDRGDARTLRLEGRVFGSGRTAVVFAHMFPSSQDAWFDFAEQIARAGFLALTFNFRGYGLSEGSRDPSRAGLDVAAAADEARARGAEAVFLVGASMGGTASIIEAAAGSAAGVAALSAPQEFQGLDARSSAAKLRAPALFVASRDDPAGAAKAGRAFYEAAEGSRRLEIVAGSAHGTDLLDDPEVGAEVRGLITSFLLDHRG